MKKLATIVKKESHLKNLLLAMSINRLSDFCETISCIYKMPTAFWIYSNENTLVHNSTKSNPNYMPVFCQNIRNLKSTNENISCIEFDKSYIEKVINKFNLHNKKTPIINKCKIGISRFVFPIYHKNTCQGVFVIGKFRDAENNNINEISNNIKLLYSNLQLGSLANLEKLIETIPLLDIQRKRDITTKMSDIIPLISSFYENTSFQGKYSQNFIFFNEIEQQIPSIVLNRKELTIRTKQSLQTISSRINIVNSSIYHSSKAPYTDLDLFSSTNDNQQKKLSLASNTEFFDLLNLDYTSVELPTSNNIPLAWISENAIYNYFGSTNIIAFIYKTYFNSLLIFIYTINPETDSETKSILHQSSDILFSKINLNLFMHDADEEITDTGHQLRRTHAGISTGLYTLQDKLSNSDIEKNEFIDAIKAMENGLAKLDILIRNFKANRELKNSESEDELNDVTNLCRIDVHSVINKALNMFQGGIKKSNLFKLHRKIPTFFLTTNEDLFELLIFNVIDNACKYAYNNTTIHIRTYKSKTYKFISISNLGIGIAEEELERVFERGYKSIYRSDKKTNPGSGIGLYFAKKFIAKYFSENKGQIFIKSKRLNSRIEKFDGDNFLTTLTIKFKSNE